MATGFFQATPATSGAPNITNVAGTFITWLRWFLDTANPAGHWEEVFSGTNLSVFRAKTGHRFFLRVDDTAGATAIIRAYESMSGHSTGVDEYPKLTVRASAALFFNKNTAATSRAWFATRTSRLFWIVNPWAGTTVADLMAFGDYPSTDSADGYCSLCYAGISTSTSTTASGSGSVGTRCRKALSSDGSASTGSDKVVTGAFARNSDGTVKATGAYLYEGRWATTVASSGCFGIGGGPPYIGMGGHVAFSRIEVIDFHNNALTATGLGLTNSWHRSYIPYLFAINHNSGVAIGDEFPSGGVTYRVAGQAEGSTNGLLAIMTTDSEPDLP